MNLDELGELPTEEKLLNQGFKKIESMKLRDLGEELNKLLSSKLFLETGIDIHLHPRYREGENYDQIYTIYFRIRTP